MRDFPYDLQSAAGRTDGHACSKTRRLVYGRGEGTRRRVVRVLEIRAIRSIRTTCTVTRVFGNLNDAGRPRLGSKDVGTRDNSPGAVINYSSICVYE